MGAGEGHGGDRVTTAMDESGEQVAPRPGPGAERDELLRVAGAADARAALDAAESLVLVDGRATAWMALAELTYIGAVLTLFGPLVPARLPTAVPYLAFGALLVLSLVCRRAGGVQVKPLSPRMVGAAVAVFLVAIVAMIVFTIPESWFPAFLGLCAAGVVLTAVVRWVRSRRRGRHPGWRPGTEAFAVLSMLEAAGALTPDRLGARAGLDPATSDRWIERLRSDHAIMGGHERRRPLGRDWIRITDTGRERLARMRAELEQQAAGVPVG